MTVEWPPAWSAQRENPTRPERFVQRLAMVVSSPVAEAPTLVAPPVEPTKLEPLKIIVYDLQVGDQSN